MVSKNVALESAIEVAKKKYANDKMAILCGILGCSNSYIYKCISEGEAGLPLALKLEILLGGEYKWQQFSPAAAENIESVFLRVPRNV